jgi:hypothetical protein
MAKPLQMNLAENRAIHASQQRGVSVMPPGTLKPARVAVPHIGKVPKLPDPFRKRKYYGEI